MFDFIVIVAWEVTYFSLWHTFTSDQVNCLKVVNNSWTQFMTPHPRIVNYESMYSCPRSQRTSLLRNVTEEARLCSSPILKLQNVIALGY
jgi:hypothetical protein